MNNITCPVCGAEDTHKNITQEILSEPFGGSVQIDMSEYTCANCGSVGDFANENDDKVELALKELKDNAVESIIEAFSNSKITLSSIERALELPQRTLTKWKNKASSPTAVGVSLLKFLKLFPWLIDVAENKYDYSTAQKIHVNDAMQRVVHNMTFSNDEIKESGIFSTETSKLFYMISGKKDMQTDFVPSQNELPFLI